MSTPPASKTRDEAFSRVGRNLANFQLLEKLLNTLLPELQFSANLSAPVAKPLQKFRPPKKASLGTLSDLLHTSLYLAPKATDAAADLEPGAFSVSITRSASRDFVREQKRKWSSLVKERNRLVHTDLLSYDLTQDSECERLSRYLDEQNLRIRELYEDVHFLLEMRVHAGERLQEFLSSSAYAERSSAPENDA